MLGRKSLGATRTAWSALKRKLGLNTEEHKGRRSSGGSGIAVGSKAQSPDGNDDDEDEGGAAEQAPDNGNGNADEADEDQEDIEPIRKTNSRGQVTLKTELEARRQAAGKRPDGRKAKLSENKKQAPRKKAKDRVPRKTNKQRYVWIPPKAEGEASDDGSETIESDKAEVGAEAGAAEAEKGGDQVEKGADARPDIAEEIIPTVETEEQQAPMQTERPAEKRKTTENDVVSTFEAEEQQSRMDDECPSRKRKTSDEEEETREEEEETHKEEEGLPGIADRPQAADIQHLVKRRKKVHDAGDKETAEGAVSTDSTTGGAVAFSKTQTFDEGEIEKMFDLGD